MFELAQAVVVLLELGPLDRREATGLLESGDCFQRIPSADFGQVTAVEELQELDDEFDVANAAASRFDITAIAAFDFGVSFDASFERPDAGNVGQAEVAAINPRFQPV